MYWISKIERCVDPKYRAGRSCVDCYFAHTSKEDGFWRGSNACWGAECIAPNRKEVESMYKNGMTEQCRNHLLA